MVLILRTLEQRRLFVCFVCHFGQISNERQKICLIVGTKEMKEFMEILYGVYFALDMASMTTLIQMD